MSFGFYRELEDVLTNGSLDADFGFLENVPVGDAYNLYDFLHGQCDDFAAAMSDCFGYRIEHLMDRCGGLIHAYCVYELPNGETALIDARGITTDEEVFFKEFSDFCTYDKGDIRTSLGKCQIYCFRNSQEMYHYGYRDKDLAGELYEFFKDNRSIYDVKDFQRENCQVGSVERLIGAAVEKWNKVVRSLSGNKMDMENHGDNKKNTVERDLG